MTELEKMRAGRLYRSDAPELLELRRRAKELCGAYNALPPGDRAGMARLAGKLLGALGEGFCMEAPIRFDYGWNTSIGKNFYANYGLTVLDCAPVTIGDGVLLGPNVQIYAAAHPIHPAERAAGLEYARPIVIGDGVWIGGGAILCPGAKIGVGAVIGAGSVVTGEIPPGVVAAGNPCRVLREITEADRMASGEE